MTAPEPRLVVGDYELGERIGTGRIARVHRARGPAGEVALKLLAPDAELDDPAAVARFRHEVAALAAVEHPNVVALLDYGVDDELGPYLVMPLVEGRTLRAIMAAGPVEPAVAALGLRELAGGLAALHRAGLIHRDLKPENIIVDAGGRPIILDLGLAWAATQTRHTERGAIAGSVPYMAPEQIDGRDPTPATDLWALAVIAHEWITGTRPFARARQPEEVAAILAGTFEPLADRDRRVAAELGALFDRCLSRDDRPRDGGEVHAALARIAPGDASAALRDPVAASEAESLRASSALVAEARALLARGKAFAAADLVERAAAHRPQDPEVLALADEVGRAPAPERRSKLPWLAVAAAAIAGGVAVFLFTGGDRDAAPPPAQPTGPKELSAADIPESVTPDRTGLDLLVIERHLQLVPSDDIPGLGYPLGLAPDEAAASDDASIHERYARALLAGTTRTAGMKFLEQSLEKFPDDASLWYLRGVAAKHTSDYDTAERALTRVLELAPDHVDALRERGELRRLRGQLRAAFVDLKRALELAPEDPGVVSNLVRIYVAVGRSEEALPMARRAADRDPEKAQPLLDLAAILPDEKALPLLQEALMREPRSPNALKAMCLTAGRLKLPSTYDHCFQATIAVRKDTDITLTKAKYWENRGDVGRAYSELVAEDGDVRLVVERARLAELAGYGYALPELWAQACRMGHQPSCDRAADNPDAH